MAFLSSKRSIPLHILFIVFTGYKLVFQYFACASLRNMDWRLFLMASVGADGSETIYFWYQDNTTIES